jgi:protein phosphatase
MATSATESMSSARGAALSAPRPPAPEADEATQDLGGREEGRSKRHPVRTSLLLVLLLVVLGGGVWYGWTVTQSRYYVGATDDGTVAIFKGVPGKVAWLDLSKVYRRSDLHLADLTQSSQDTVRSGIIASSEPDAENKLLHLHDPGNMARTTPCPSAVPSTDSSSVPASPSASLTPSATTVAGPSASITPTQGGSDSQQTSTSPSPSASTSC